VGGIFASASSLAALLIKFHHVDPWIAVAIALLAGVVLGGLNGVLTGVLKVPLIIVSLGTLSAYFGLHLILSEGKAVYGLPKDHPFFTWLGGDLFDLPVSVWTSVGCAVFLYFVFGHTRFGATVRAIGSNPVAAEFIGIKTSLIRIYATALVGLLAAFSGLKSANPDFIVIDVRGPNAFANGHLEDAINIPHREITAARMAEYPKGKMFVVYCAGPHCNGANKAALATVWRECSS
jgi:ribose/xylose/arabinose/galactoside ABC-type transport system permease subunit